MFGGFFGMGILGFLGDFLGWDFWGFFSVCRDFLGIFLWIFWCFGNFLGWSFWDFLGIFLWVFVIFFLGWDFWGCRILGCPDFSVLWGILGWDFGGFFSGFLDGNFWGFWGNFL